MSLYNRLNNICLNNKIYSNEEIYSLVDLTLLKDNITQNEIIDLSKAAKIKNVAAVCTYPEKLSYLPSDFNLLKATVVNFPTGNQVNKEVEDSIHQAISIYKANEIDYVFQYQNYLNGNKDMAFKACHKAHQICKENNITFKVIIETGALLTIDNIYDVSYQLANQGCDYIKTSTGKISIGATIEAAFAILAAIKDNNANTGIKVSGGIKSFKLASKFIELAEHMLNKQHHKSWIRIGTSGLMSDADN